MSVATTLPVQTTIPESDLQAHIEDDLTVNAIRDGKLVEVHWNDLTEDERRAANVVMFHIYE